MGFRSRWDMRYNQFWCIRWSDRARRTSCHSDFYVGRIVWFVVFDGELVPFWTMLWDPTPSGIIFVFGSGHCRIMYLFLSSCRYVWNDWWSRYLFVQSWCHVHVDYCYSLLRCGQYGAFLVRYCSDFEQKCLYQFYQYCTDPWTSPPDLFWKSNSVPAPDSSGTKKEDEETERREERVEDVGAWLFFSWFWILHAECFMLFFEIRPVLTLATIHKHIQLPSVSRQRIIANFRMRAPWRTRSVLPWWQDWVCSLYSSRKSTISAVPQTKGNEWILAYRHSTNGRSNKVNINRWCHLQTS